MNYDDEGFERPGKIGMNYDLWKSTEPDDSDVVYYDNWKAAERAAKRMVKSAAMINERDRVARLKAQGLCTVESCGFYANDGSDFCPKHY